jgi:hydrogenase nickel incorporation protein HypA/HybF
MHELSITQSMLNLVVEQAKELQVERVSKISIVIGEMSSIVADCVCFYFDFLSKDTIAQDAELAFEHIPIQVRCRNCHAVFKPADFDWSCPNCHECGIEVVAGRECYIESIEVE